ncbi:E3 ubiquitin-protein ligase tom1, partial [Coemansia sp. RSA 1358]
MSSYENNDEAGSNNSNRPGSASQNARAEDADLLNTTSTTHEQTEPPEPMAVDSSDQEGESGNAGSSNQKPEEQNLSQSGIEPYNNHEWRNARDAEVSEQRQKLNKLRDELRDSIIPRAIEIIDKHKDKAVFQLRGVLKLVIRKNDSAPAVHMLLNAFTPLLDSASISGEDKEADERLAAHAYLWAVLLGNTQLLDEIHSQVGKLSLHLVRALDIASQRADRSPPWATALLLVIEMLLQRDSEPPHKKIDSKEDLQRAAKRGLTKLPPSSTALSNEASAQPENSSTSVSFGPSGADVISRLFESTPIRGPSGSAFEPIMSNDGSDEDGQDESTDNPAS